MVSGIGKYAGHGSTTGTQVRNMSRLETTSGEFELRHAMDKQTDQ